MLNTVQPNVSLSPFLKWAGGKSKLIQQYQNYFPKEGFKRYYEPFLGGGAVFFYLQPQFAVLTDINKELIDTYCCVRDNVIELILLLERHQSEHYNDKTETHNYYYNVRSRIYNTSIERAARLIYLNKTCFNGLYRVNSKGEFNVPVGKYKHPKICNTDLLYAASAALKSAEIEVRNFDYILDYAKTSEDFVYFDPPYYPLSQTSDFTAYSTESFNEDNQIKLRDIFVELVSRGVKVMLSNSDAPFIRNLYSDDNIFSSHNRPKIHEISALRVINSDIKKRGKITELLITSY
ncbi:MAG: DNA adenine methylase [Coleofasciculus sp. Co-bin14]|nr:DNA adenine methylase [Coleofasciculus sp. Co-bin14]